MIRFKHATIALLPFVLLFGCNNDNAADERRGVDIENARYNPPNNRSFNEDRNAMNDPNLTLDDNTNNRNDNNVTNNNTNDNNNGNVNGMAVSDRAENRLEKLKEVRTAKVIVTDQNAYAAVLLSNGKQDQLTNQLEEKVANEVRKADPNVKKVYVSANPDFVQRMQGYGDKIDEGRPITGLFDEFTDTVRRVFPDAH
ncbi:YhcN/YlaJ family sporulation lipoprotein [Pseudobacillus sp. FSL P4-0506]|uniref:YhcN/YlaJ family sporulation lipoprotein n=1 Tax=Pseudobacillus sp. FSL P4-0506 TaxID=2921576 RepID=UPI0030F72CA9